MLLVIYLSLILPYRLAFLTGWELGFVVTDFLMDVFFLFDILLNFCTALGKPSSSAAAPERFLLYPPHSRHCAHDHTLAQLHLSPHRCAVLEDGTVCTSRWKIAKSYGRTWLPIDLVASLPLEWFLEGISFSEP